jgi:hypothetical protein
VQLIIDSGHVLATYPDSQRIAAVKQHHPKPQG